MAVLTLSGVVGNEVNLMAISTAAVPRLNAKHWGMYGGDVRTMDLDVATYDLPIHPGGWAYPSFGDAETKQAFWDDVRNYRQSGRYKLPILGLKGTFEERVRQLERVFSNEDGTRVYYQDLVGVALGHEVTTLDDAMENRLYDYIKSRWPALQVYKFYSIPIKPYTELAGGNPERSDGYLYDIYGGDADTFRRTVQKFVITGKPVVIIIWASEPGWAGYFPGDLVGEFSVRKQDEAMAMEVGAAEQDGLIRKAPNSDLERYFRHASNTLREFGLPVLMFGVSGPGSVGKWYWGNEGANRAESSPNLLYILESLAFPLRDEMRRSVSGEPKPSADYSQGLDVEVIGTGSKTAFDYGLQQAEYRAGMEEVPRRILPGPFVDNFAPDDVYIGLRTIDHATIRGFTRLLLTDQPGGVLVTRDEAGQPGAVELVYRFFTRQGTLGNISVDLTGSVDPAGKGVNSLALSKDGLVWEPQIKSTPGVADTETLLLDGGEDYQGLSEFYVRIRMAYSSSPIGRPANALEKLTVRCVRSALQ